MGSPLGGSALVQVAPICWHRIRAAGPGKFKATLRMRTPRKGLIGLGVLAGARVSDLAMVGTAMGMNEKEDETRVTDGFNARVFSTKNRGCVRFAGY
jgi:hypothetical protein